MNNNIFQIDNTKYINILVLFITLLFCLIFDVSVFITRNFKLIVKDKEIAYSSDIKQQAGHKQDVAFFLRSAFKDSKEIFVFNDIRIEHNGEVAQIDHLILYIYGFILIESQSITGEVKVNSNQEWSQSDNGKWSGIASPITQVELQQKLLREILWENRQKILTKKILGKLQQSFGGRCWNNICAVSNNAIEHQDNMPKTIAKQLVKSEFLVDSINKVMSLPLNRIAGLLDFKRRPYFSAKDMENICSFLTNKHQPASILNKNISQNKSTQVDPESVVENNLQ